MVGTVVGVVVGVGPGPLDTVMYPDLERPFVPAEFDTFNLTEYKPAFIYEWLGYCSVETEPSPNAHAQLVGELIDLSVNCTNNGLTPPLVDTEKSVFGGTIGPTVVGTVVG